MFHRLDARINRELAILLVHLQREGLLEKPIQPELLAAIQATDDRQQQIHYAYCLRLLNRGWTERDTAAITAWYDGTRTWKGGASFAGFLANIFRDTLGGFDIEQRKAILAAGDRMPLPALALARRLQTDRQPELLDALVELQPRLQGPPELKQASRTRTRRRCAPADARELAASGPWSGFVQPRGRVRGD
jgi:hypothetical protein